MYRKEFLWRGGGHGRGESLFQGCMGSGHGVLRGVETEGEGVDTRAKTASDVMPRESLKVFKEGSNQMRFALKKKSLWERFGSRARLEYIRQARSWLERSEEGRGLGWGKSSGDREGIVGGLQGQQHKGEVRKR